VVSTTGSGEFRIADSTSATHNFGQLESNEWARPMLDTCDTVYVIDPDESVHDAISTLLEAAKVRVECYRTPEAFQSVCAARNTQSCCVLVEAVLPGIGSLALIRDVLVRNPGIPIIVLASTADGEIAAQALKAGALDVIDKPLFGMHLLEKILRAAATSGYAVAH
jgi:FixJ family two-component response regulator